MYAKLKGLIGNVPIRLIATFLVAILIPSLLVTGIGILALVQADHLVKGHVREPYVRRLHELHRRVTDEWERRFESYGRRLLDADERGLYLAKWREDPYLADVLIEDASGLRLLPASAPLPELRLDVEHAALREARRLEAEGADAGALVERYREIREASTGGAVEFLALLGESRSLLRLERRSEAIEALDRALERHGKSVDETGVLLEVPLLLRKVEILGPNDPLRRRTAEDLARALEREQVDAAMRSHYLARLRQLVGDLPESSADERASPAVVREASLPVLGDALERPRPGPDAEVPVFSHVKLPGEGDVVFASYPSEGGEVTVHLLLDRRRFLEDAFVFLGDVGIPEGALRVSSLDELPSTEPHQDLGSIAVPPPFARMEWRYVPEPGSLPPGFTSFDFFRTVGFTWAVIVLVLAILAGTFVTLRSVLREMQTARLKTDFVSFISHELKTPLSAIRMFSETLLEGRVEDEEEMRTCLRLIDMESERLTNLIDRVLEYSRIQNRQRVLNLTSCSMEDVVKQAVQIFCDHHKSRPREIEVNAVQHISKTKMDRASMVELMLNLLSNAAKYSPPDKKIVVNLRESISEITVEVIDHGVGIRKRDQRRIFDKFFRADDYLTRDIEGYGLGLAFARYIARQHKGDIRVSSQLNSGSVFTLTLQKTDVLAE